MFGEPLQSHVRGEPADRVRTLHLEPIPKKLIGATQ
jgi:hypothetical protein